GRPGRAGTALGRCEPARSRLPPGRHDSQARQRQARQRAGDCKGLAPGTVCTSARRPSGKPGGRPVSPADSGAGVLVLPLEGVCLGLLWLRPRPVAATFTPGLAVLPAPARPTWWG